MRMWKDIYCEDNSSGSELEKESAQVKLHLLFKAKHALFFYVLIGLKFWELRQALAPSVSS